MPLSPDDIDAIAERTAEILAERDLTVGRYIDVRAAARRLSMSEDWVREHAAELGGARMGDGDRGELRFDVRRLDQAFEARRLERERPRPRRRPGRRATGGVPLLPLPGKVAGGAGGG